MVPRQNKQKEGFKSSMMHGKNSYQIPEGYVGPLPKPSVEEKRRRFKRTLPPVTARALIHGCISAPEWSLKTFTDLGGSKAAIELGAVETIDAKTIAREEALILLDMTVDDATDKWLAQYAHKVAEEQREARVRSEARLKGYLNYGRQQWIDYVIDRLSAKEIDFELSDGGHRGDIIANCPHCSGKRTLLVKVVTSKKEVPVYSGPLLYRESTGALFRCSSCIEVAKDEAQTLADQSGLPMIPISDGYRNAVTFELSLIAAVSLYGLSLPWGDKVRLREARQNIIRFMLGQLSSAPSSEIPTLRPAAKKRAIESCLGLIEMKVTDKGSKEWRLPAKLYRAIIDLARKDNRSSLVLTGVNHRELMSLAGLHNKASSMPAAKRFLSDRGLVTYIPEDKNGSYLTIAVNHPRTRIPYAFDVPRSKPATKNRRPNDSLKPSSWDYAG